MSGTVRARLNKAGNAVLCGRVAAKTGAYNCGGRFGAVAAMPVEMDGTDTVIDGALVFLPATTRPYFTFDPGYQECSPDRWALTNDARERYEADKQRASVGDPRDARTIQANTRLAEGHSIRFRGPYPSQMDGERRQARHSTPLPKTACCPDCGTINVIDDEVIERHRREHLGKPGPKAKRL